MEQDLEQFQLLFLGGPQSPNRRVIQQTWIPRTSVWHVVKKPLFLNPYRMHSLQAFSIKYKVFAQIAL